MSIASPLMLPSPKAGGSASALSLSRPAQASHTLRPAGSLAASPRLPLSQGSDPASYPTEPPASFRTYRQLSGWILLTMVRALGAHCQGETQALQQGTCSGCKIAMRLFVPKSNTLRGEAAPISSRTLAERIATGRRQGQPRPQACERSGEAGGEVAQAATRARASRSRLISRRRD